METNNKWIGKTVKVRLTGKKGTVMDITSSGMVFVKHDDGSRGIYLKKQLIKNAL